MHEVIAPALGMASTEVVLTEWLKEPGDAVASGEILARIETDKAELDIESPAAGVLGAHRWDAGAAVPNGEVLVVVLEPGEDESGAAGPDPVDAAPAVTEPPPEAAPARAGDTVEQTATAPADASNTAAERVPPPPAARERDAAGDLVPFTQSPRERSDAAAEPGSGAPIQPAAPAAPTSPPPAAPAATAAPAERPAISAVDPDASRYRAAVAAAVTRSWNEIPHFAVTSEIAVEGLDEALRAIRAIEPKATFTDVLIKAYALALVSRLGTTEIDLGLAVATERGVAMPVVTAAATSNLVEIAAARAAAVDRARTGRTIEADARPKHSAISNLGAYGVHDFTGIVPVGETSLLTVGAAATRPVVREGELQVGRTMFATLNVDHREWDGQHAGEVLQRLAAIASEPTLLLAM